MAGRTLRVGTRTSPLALAQVREVARCLRGFYPSIRLEIVGIDTCGDRDRRTPLSGVEGTDFFTREIDQALLRGEIDFAVHSAKDLPDRVHGGLHVAAITGSPDPHDALVSKGGLRIDGLPRGAKIGASSLRRKAQLKSYRRDFRVVDIRGNVEERLKTLHGSDLDAIVVAACGLKRLGLGSRITQIIPPEILEPHPLQGCIAVVARKDDAGLIGVLSKIGGGGAVS